MSDTPLIAILGAAGVTTVGGLLDFLAVVDDYEASLIQYLARGGGPENAGAHLSEAQAETAIATAAGWREIAGAIDNADDAIDDPDRH